MSGRFGAGAKDIPGSSSGLLPPARSCFCHLCCIEVTSAVRGLLAKQPVDWQFLKPEAPYIRQTSPNKADCNAALAKNPDSGKAFRVRGKAHAAKARASFGPLSQPQANRLLGHWEEANANRQRSHINLKARIDLEAHQDLAESQKLDFDDDTAEAQRALSRQRQDDFYFV